MKRDWMFEDQVKVKGYTVTFSAVHRKSVRSQVSNVNPVHTAAAICALHFLIESFLVLSLLLFLMNTSQLLVKTQLSDKVAWVDKRGTPMFSSTVTFPLTTNKAVTVENYFILTDNTARRCIELWIQARYPRKIRGQTEEFLYCNESETHQGAEAFTAALKCLWLHDHMTWQSRMCTCFWPWLGEHGSVICHIIYQNCQEASFRCTFCVSAFVSHQQTE